ncbi:4924_t:CDS:2 [Entrophospora sp. SA101]|nr:4924_t:CDS:2 [Entrophospora sp. SA101]
MSTRKTRQNNYDEPSSTKNNLLNNNVEERSSSFCNSSLNSTYPSSLQSTVVGSYFFAYEDDNAGSSSDRMFLVLDKALDTKILNDIQSSSLNSDVANDESNDVIDESDDGSDGWRNWIKKNSFQNILAILLNHSRKILNKRILIKTFAFYLNNSKWWIFPAIVLFLSYCYTCQFSLSNHQCAFWIIKTTDLDSQYRNYIVINDDDDHHQNQYEVGFEYSDSLVRAVIEEQVKNICAAEVEKRIKPPPSQQAKHEITTYRRYVVDDVIANLIRNEIHKSVEEKLYDYSQDKLNRADYALSSGGAKIISMLTSPTYETWPTKWFQQIIASVTGHGITRGKPPITAIQPEMHVGQCWPFAGEKGQLAVLLSRKIFVTAVTYEHVTKKLAMDVTSAPKEFEVWGSKFHVDAHDIVFHYKKKKGFFRFEDNLEDLIIKQAHQLVERFEEQMIIVQTQVMQNYRCHSTTKDIGNDQSKDKLKQKMTWKSSAFDPTLGTTTSSSAGGSGSGAAGGGDVDYNVTASSTNITPIIPVTPITTVTPAAATYNSASIIKATTDGKTPSNK